MSLGMELESCRKCVYHVMDDRDEVSCCCSDDIDHCRIVRRDDGPLEVMGCPREKAV